MAETHDAAGPSGREECRPALRAQVEEAPDAGMAQTIGVGIAGVEVVEHVAGEVPGGRVRPGGDGQLDGGGVAGVITAGHDRQLHGLARADGDRAERVGPLALAERHGAAVGDVAGGEFPAADGDDVVHEPEDAVAAARVGIGHAPADADRPVMGLVHRTATPLAGPGCTEIERGGRRNVRDLLRLARLVGGDRPELRRPVPRLDARIGLDLGHLRLQQRTAARAEGVAPLPEHEGKQAAGSGELGEAEARLIGRAILVFPEGDEVAADCRVRAWRRTRRIRGRSGRGGPSRSRRGLRVGLAAGGVGGRVE